MLNKLKFNNLVISNKKGIQQSRIQTINKLVHKIRKLKTLLEKHPDNTKCKERIRKSTETMELLKKLTRVNIMKKILLMDKPAPVVLTNGLATPEEVAVALLSMNKVMQVLLVRFKTELQLNEVKSDEWKQVLMESSKRRQKIEKTEEKRRKRLELKQQKVMSCKRQEWLQENQQAIERTNVSDDINSQESTIGNWQIEELSKNNNIAEADEKLNNKSKKELKRSLKVKPISNKIDTPKKKQKVFLKNLEESTIIGNTKSEEENKNDSEETHIFIQNSEKEEPEESLVVDPFFITDNGENYLSTAVAKKNVFEEEDSYKERNSFHMIKLNNSDKKSFNLKNRHQQSWVKNQNDFRQKMQHNKNKWKNNEGNSEQSNEYNTRRGKEQNNGIEKFSQNDWNNKKNNLTKEQSFKNNKFAIIKQPNKLHPSWAAKQILKPVITEFQGKKITFGDDGASNHTQNLESKYQTKPLKTEIESLHPSWAAKQKLKPTITAFQGKKITFDNED